jgi:hypothetical protein
MSIQESLRELAYKAWSFARNAHRLYPDNNHTFSDYSTTLLGDDMKAAESKMSEHVMQQAIAYSKWKDGLSPAQKCTVWPPAGSGSGTGLYDMSDDDLYDKFVRHQSKIEPSPSTI